MFVRFHEEITRAVTPSRLIHHNFLQVGGQAGCVQKARHGHQRVPNNPFVLLCDKQYVGLLIALPQHVIECHTKLVAANRLATCLVLTRKAEER